MNYTFMVQDIPVVLSALPRTIALTLCSLFFAIMIAVLFGTCILKNIPVVKHLLITINTVLKGIPLMIQLLLCYYSIPYLLRAVDGVFGYEYNPQNPSYFAFAVVAFSFNYGAYMTDVVVSSYKAVEESQLEAAHAVGMTTLQGLFHIVIPQAAVISVPNLSNYFMWLLKATSLASVVNVFEILATARMSTADNYAILEGYIVAAAIYWAVCILAEKALKLLDKKLGRYRREIAVS